MSAWRESWGSPQGQGGAPFGGGGMSFGWPPMTPMVKRIVLVTCACFLAQWIVSLVSTPASRALIEIFGLNPEEGALSWLLPFPMLWQLGTSALLHASSGLGHLFWNMFTLYMLGVMLEQAIEARRFLTHYVASVLFAGAVSLCFKFLLDVHSPSVGASGGVAGVVVAIATLQPQRRILLLFFPVTLMVVGILWVAADTFAGISEIAAHLRGEQLLSNVDHFAHIGGALYGYLAVKRQWIFRDPIEQVDAWRVASDQKRAASDAQRMDGLLDRIQKEGMSKLSESEREFLRRMSKRGR